MYNFNKILVCVDNTEIDSEIITAASLVSTLSNAVEVHFISIMKEMNIPSSVLKQFPNLINDSINDRKKEIQEKIDELFLDQKAKTTINVTAGSVTKTILSYSLEMDADLIVMGRKNEVKGGGVSINRIARRANCSLMILPKGYNPVINKLLVPIDFSDSSLNSLNQTIDLAYKSKNDIEVVTQNVYQVPTGYHYTGKTFKEFAKIIQENAAKEYTKYAKKLINADEVKMSQLYTLDKNDSVIDQVYSTAKKINADGIVISAKGRTKSTSMFISSKAERMIAVNIDLPLLVCRPKGEQDGILDYIKTL